MQRIANYIVYGIAAICLLGSSCSNRYPLPVDLVNTLQGSNSTREFSTGNTYPAVAVPWGMNFWTPQTRKNGDGWQYVYSDLKIQGFKQTHQPSPWINDYGCFSIMPQSSSPVPDQKRRAASYSRENEFAAPFLYKVKFDNGIETSMSATNSCCAFKFSFIEGEESFLLIDCFPMKGKITVDVQRNRIYGFSNYRASNNKSILPDNFGTYFVIETDTSLEDFCIMQNGKALSGYTEAEGENMTAYVSFGKQKEVMAYVASSFISYEQAERNLRREIGKKSFKNVVEESRKKWNDQLSVITVDGGSEEEYKTFYTALYRTMLFPRRTYEYDATGKQVHYGFFDGKIHEGPMYADNGFWDTFRAVHPLFTILVPSVSEEIMDALINIYQEGGWLPEWFSPAYKDCMIGQNSVSVITDSYVKGIGRYDTSMMMEAILEGAEAEGPNATGRRGYDYYNKYGFIPSDSGIKHSVSRTLEYSYDDFCIAVYAHLIGKPDSLVNKYLERAFNYRNVFDKRVNFMRPRNEDGCWDSDFAPDTWSQDFTEGSSWHWTWSVFHDPAGLIRLMGGERNFINKMDSVFVAKPTIGLGFRNKMIHEMREMIAADMGQYAHGNQPIQHMVYLYNYAGAPYKTQEKVHEIMSKLYYSGQEDGKGLCGDEDNGQTSAWYVFSALGFYPVCPGTGEYVIGKPLFDHARILLESGKQFVVKLRNNSEENIYIQSAMLNGKDFRNSFITHDMIMEGGVLEFEMGPNPNVEWASSSRPFSLSDYVNKFNQ